MQDEALDHLVVRYGDDIDAWPDVVRRDALKCYGEAALRAHIVQMQALKAAFEAAMPTESALSAALKGRLMAIVQEPQQHKVSWLDRLYHLFVAPETLLQPFVISARAGVGALLLWAGMAAASATPPTEIDLSSSVLSADDDWSFEITEEVF